MISLSIALAFVAVVITLGRIDMQRHASRERVVLAELQGKADAEKRELATDLAEAYAQHKALTELAAQDRAAWKATCDDHARRIGELEVRWRNATAPGVRR